MGTSWEAIFDYNGGMYGLLLAALPLKEGFKATFPTLSEDRDELDRDKSQSPRRQANWQGQTVALFSALPVQNALLQSPAEGET
jgi:hypothetical protein